MVTSQTTNNAFFTNFPKIRFFHAAHRNREDQRFLMTYSTYYLHSINPKVPIYAPCQLNWWTDQALNSLNLRTFVRACVHVCEHALPLTVESSGSSLTQACRLRVPIVGALSGVLRYPLLTAIATRYQFTDVAMPSIIETSGSSLTHAWWMCGFASRLRAQCCAQVPLTHCHCNTGLTPKYGVWQN